MAGLSDNKKLVWLGFKNPQQDVNQAGTDLQRLKNNVGDYATFRGHLDAYDLDSDGSDEDISNFTQFKTYLTDNGFTSLEADAFIDKIKNAFTDTDSSGSVYDEFEDYVENTASSYEELQSQFGTASGVTGEQETSDGEKVAGVIFHEEAGVSKDGVSVEAGTTEIFGTRIELSSSGDAQTDTPNITYSNLSVSDTLPKKGEQITISADIANTGSASGDAYPQLKIDGEVAKSKGPITLSSGGSTSVSFTYSFDQFVSVDVTISTLSPTTVSVVPQELEQ